MINNVIIRIITISSGFVTVDCNSLERLLQTVAVGSVRQTRQALRTRLDHYTKAILPLAAVGANTAKEQDVQGALLCILVVPAVFALEDTRS